MPIQTVAIVGVGLIGGSFSLALRAHGFRGRILGVSSQRTIRAALAAGAIDAGESLERALPQADLIYLSQPISRILSLLSVVRQWAKPEALVTDAGSTKQEIVKTAAALFTEKPWFIGGHPMAGKEGRGVEIAESQLFRDSTYVLTPANGILPKTPLADEFLVWLRKIGAKVVVQAPEIHDQVVTWTSHVPQLASSALAGAIFENLAEDNQLTVAGAGLRDMTRLAESPFEIWKDILATNRDNLAEALAAYIQKLETFRRHLGEEGLRQDFDTARAFRKKFKNVTDFPGTDT